MNILVGHTGFVGSNIALSYQFDACFNSKNIETAFETKPALCVYSGVRSEMFLANSDPDADLAAINHAIENIQKIKAQQLVLISTVAVYDHTTNVDENSPIAAEKLTAYGKNRKLLEEWVESNCANAVIVRLPALYGNNLKKNFLYDLIHLTPTKLTAQKFAELIAIDDFIKPYYELEPSGFYACTDSKKVKPYFKQGFNALNFTDSRSVYQFYNLAHLWEHIQFCIKNTIGLANLVTEPVSTAEVYKAVMNADFNNELQKTPFNYNIKSRHFANGYIFDKKTVMHDIFTFVAKNLRD